MAQDGGPFCIRHDGDVRMTLRTLHSDASSPDRVVGLYECPECGYERRLPMEHAA